ncbi:hypothetical protein [Micromonospora andamanensis]|nr:hypothetical protein [Micromonospora andamanensis]
MGDDGTALGDGPGATVSVMEAVRLEVSSTERARVPDEVDVHASGEEKLGPLRHEAMLPAADRPGQRSSTSWDFLRP